MGTGTNMAVSSAQVTLAKGNLRGLAWTGATSIAAAGNMKRSLGCTFPYNSLRLRKTLLRG